jgi:predicted nucleic acid-binding protein
VNRFVDTSFVVALMRSRERHHLAATAIWRSTDKRLLMTTDGVLGEIWTVMRRKEHHAAAVAAVDAVRATVTVVLVHDTEVASAWKWLRTRHEHPYSFVDALSFEVMRQHGMTEALAFDDDFTRAGYVEVRP